MIPIDHKIFNDLAHKRFVYTRYADDIHISCVQKFDWREMMKYIESVLKEFGAPWQIKPEKTHYGSRKGSNWMLGIMLNKDNKMTVGWRNKENFRAMTNNLIQDWKHGVRWPTEDIQHYSGLLSYYKMIEKEHFENMLAKYNAKYNVDIRQILKSSYNVIC